MKGFQRITAPLAQKSAVALGFFDGVHLGHRAVLGAAARCAAEQELLACAFTFAADSVPVKQGVPLSYLYTDTQKAELMQDCGIQGVYCPAFSELCGLDGEAFCRQVLVELLHAQEVFCGGDFRFGAKAAWNIDSCGNSAASSGSACIRSHRCSAAERKFPPPRSGRRSVPESRNRQRICWACPITSAAELSTGQHWDEPSSPDDQHSLCSRTAGAAVWRVCFTDAHSAGQLRFHYGYWSQAHCQRSTAAGGRNVSAALFRRPVRTALSGGIAAFSAGRAEIPRCGQPVPADRTGSETVPGMAETT